MRSAVLSALLIAGSLACSGSETVDAGIVDTGPVDTGIVDTGMVDTGVVDMGSPPVCGEIANECNPVDGTGCTGADEFCVLGTSSPQTFQCRLLIPAPPVAEGQVCNPANRNCAPGHVCVQFQGEPDPLCYKICDAGPTMGGCGCETTTARTTCFQFAGGGLGRPRFGTCQ